MSLRSFGGKDISDTVSKGDKALNENKFNDALNYYRPANDANPSEVVLYKKMAKAQFGLKDYAGAEENFKIYLQGKPDDTDVLIELGEAQRQRGHYKEALGTFEKAYDMDNSNDLAKRSILETKNNMLAIFSPDRAKAEKQEYASQNLNAALQMAVNYMSPSYMKELEDVRVQFGETASMGGTGNIAQYENNKKTITVSNSYIYASPQVIAAYLVHESVHAHDKDPYTSVREEQDAYEFATNFWIKNAKGVKDPEMDYAANLYKQSPNTLKARVAEIYTLRDPSIAATSPNHPPQKPFHSLWSKNNESASQSIRTYDVIA